MQVVLPGDEVMQLPEQGQVNSLSTYLVCIAAHTADDGPRDIGRHLPSFRMRPPALLSSAIVCGVWAIIGSRGPRHPKRVHSQTCFVRKFALRGSQLTALDWCSRTLAADVP